MSMSELTDDQLDGLFRKSAEEFDPPFDPVAWRDMKTRLDAHDRNPAGRTPIWKNLLRWGLPIVLLLLLIGVGWYGYRKVYQVAVKPDTKVIAPNQPTVNRRAGQLQQTPETPASTDKQVRTRTGDLKEPNAETGKQPTNLVASVGEPATLKSRLDKPTNRLETNSVSGPTAATVRPVLTYRLKAEQNRPNRSRLARSETAASKDVAGTVGYEREKTNLRVSKLAQRRRKVADRQLSAPFAAINDAMAFASRPGKQRVANSRELPQVGATNAAGNVTPLATSETGQFVALPTVSELTIRPAQWPKLAFSDRPVIIQPDTTSRRVVPKVTSQRGLSVRLVVAPDLSSVGLKNFSRPGTNVGVLLEYRLASRWSVQAGVIQSTKVYRALPDEYTPTRYAHIKPENIDGQCNMLDIPLNIRYDIALRPGLADREPSRWFVSGGVTSYIMRQEDYTNNFADSNDPGIYGWQKQPVSVQTGAYGFSQLNLSVGYERVISRRLSWQVEPFMKVPLKGVGFFKIDLLSTGAFFSLRYKF